MENEWQPAILLPEDKMCDFHKALWATVLEPYKTNRNIRVGKKLRVRRTEQVLFPVEHTVVPEKDCLALESIDEHGYMTVLFSCEVSTD